MVFLCLCTIQNFPYLINFQFVLLMIYLRHEYTPSQSDLLTNYSSKGGQC